MLRFKVQSRVTSAVLAVVGDVKYPKHFYQKKLFYPVDFFALFSNHEFPLLINYITPTLNALNFKSMNKKGVARHIFFRIILYEKDLLIWL